MVSFSSQEPLPDSFPAAPRPQPWRSSLRWVPLRPHICLIALSVTCGRTPCCYRARVMRSAPLGYPLPCPEAGCAVMPSPTRGREARLVLSPGDHPRLVQQGSGEDQANRDARPRTVLLLVSGASHSTHRLHLVVQSLVSSVFRPFARNQWSVRLHLKSAICLFPTSSICSVFLSLYFHGVF